MRTRALSFLLFFTVFLCLNDVSAQVKPVQQDSAALYKKIQKYSEKRRFTKWVHGLIFEPLTPKKIQRQQREQSIRFKEYQGKIIRQIKVFTLDPFGFSERDSTKFPQKPLSKLGNRLHIKTKELTIWNLILLRRYKPLDSLLVKESERLIRTQRFVRRVVIRPVATAYPDSVDIEIRELDSWSLIPNMSLSGTKTEFELTERNFLGFGHEVKQIYQRDFSESVNAYSVHYTVPNIVNTYIRTDLIYDLDLNGQYRKSAAVNRPFYSPYARWGAGAYLEQNFRQDSIPSWVTNQWRTISFKSNTKDFWAGFSTQLFGGESEKARTTNLITAARYYKVRFSESPSLEYDPNLFYTTERNYLASIGMSSRQYIQDHYIFNYGIVEDVPIGQLLSLTAGVQNKNGKEMPYVGARVSAGRYTNIGYFAYNVDYGSFFQHGKSRRSAFVMEANYFTGLAEWGKWKVRQFLKGRFVLGNRRENSWGDEVSLLGSTGIDGFRSLGLFGTKKWVLTTQTQTFSPWNIYGFRVNPFLRCSVGMLGDAEHGFAKSTAYPQFGMGFIITNDYLVFSSFQISFAYFPNLPVDSSVFSTNAFDAEDFGLMNFELNKPMYVDYR